MTSRKFLTALLFVAALPAFAQEAYDNFTKAFASNYNQQNYDAVYDLTADNFKAQVPKDYFTQILKGAYTNAGLITEVKPVQSGGQGKVFHLICERARFALSVVLDDKGKAAGLLIQPVNDNTPTDSKGIIEKWKSNNLNAGLVVARIRDGKPDIQYYGVANKAASTPMDASTIFEIGSISKPFTGILLHMLIAEGKISLDDPVNKFLPKGSQLQKVKDKDILIRNLVTHTSCLPRMPANFNPPASELKNPYNYYSEKELLAYLPTITTDGCELGKSPFYSNLGAGLLGYILTKVSGKSYPELIKERIAKPLKTESFGVVGPSPKWAQGYTSAGEVQPQWTFTDALVGAGGVDASANDMLKILNFFTTPDQSPLGKAVVASTTPQFSEANGSFGTFWIRQPLGSNTILWHNGMTGGFNAFIGWIEGTKNGVFILSNNGEDVATGLGIAMMTEEK